MSVAKASTGGNDDENNKNDEDGKDEDCEDDEDEEKEEDNKNDDVRRLKQGDQAREQLRACRGIVS